jgi:hypothetical protein
MQGGRGAARVPGRDRTSGATDLMQEPDPEQAGMFLGPSATSRARRDRVRSRSSVGAGRDLQPTIERSQAQRDQQRLLGTQVLYGARRRAYLLGDAAHVKAPHAFGGQSPPPRRQRGGYSVCIRVHYVDTIAQHRYVDVTKRRHVNEAKPWNDR